LTHGVVVSLVLNIWHFEPIYTIVESCLSVLSDKLENGATSRRNFARKPVLSMCNKLVFLYKLLNQNYL